MDGNPSICPNTRQAWTQFITLWENFSIRSRAIRGHQCYFHPPMTLHLYTLYTLHSWKNPFSLPLVIPLLPLKSPKSRAKKSHSSATSAWCHSLAPVIFSAICSSTTTTSHTSARSVTASSRGSATFKSTCFHTWEAIPEHQGLCPSPRCSRSLHVNKWRIFSSRMGRSTSADCAPRILHASVAWRPTYACTLEKGHTCVKSALLRSPRHVLSRCTCACILERNRTNVRNAGALSQEEMRCILICTSTKVSQPCFFSLDFVKNKQQFCQRD